MKKTKASVELRQWSDSNYGGYIDGKLRGELCAIADRIDREMVELPRDGDGVPIHVGDTVFGRMSHVKMAISALRIADGGWVVYVNGGACRVDAVDVSHTRPDSLKRIADELDEMAGDASETAMVSLVELRELAERIRRLAKEGE